VYSGFRSCPYQSHRSIPAPPPTRRRNGWHPIFPIRSWKHAAYPLHRSAHQGAGAIRITEGGEGVTGMGIWKPRLGRLEAMWAKWMPAQQNIQPIPPTISVPGKGPRGPECTRSVCIEGSERFFGHFWSAAKSVTATGVAGKGVGKRELFSFFSTLEIIYPKNRPSTFLVILEIFSSTGRELG